MKLQMSFSFKVAMLSAATAAFLGTTVLFAQSDSGDGSAEMQLAQAKPSFFRRLFSRRSRRDTASQQQPSSQSGQYQQAQGGQYQQAPYAGQQKSTVQQLLESRYRALRLLLCKLYSDMTLSSLC